jgi:hypothetical protein
MEQIREDIQKNIKHMIQILLFHEIIQTLHIILMIIKFISMEMMEKKEDIMIYNEIIIIHLFLVL